VTVVISFAAAQRESDGQCVRIDDRMNLARRSAAAYDRLAGRFDGLALWRDRDSRL
jgi:hypothetical protein